MPYMKMFINLIVKSITVVTIRHERSRMKLKTEIRFCMSLMKKDIQPPPYCLARLSIESNHQTARKMKNMSKEIKLPIVAKLSLIIDN